jgi:hypothetical protein
VALLNKVICGFSRLSFLYLTELTLASLSGAHGGHSDKVIYKKKKK